MAITPITIGAYQARLGAVKSPTILPVTSAALGKKGLIFLSFKNKRSELATDKIDITKTRITFNDGLFKNAVIKMSARKIPN